MTEGPALDRSRLIVRAAESGLTPEEQAVADSDVQDQLVKLGMMPLGECKQGDFLAATAQMDDWWTKAMSATPSTVQTLPHVIGPEIVNYLDEEGHLIWLRTLLDHRLRKIRSAALRGA